MGKQSKVFTIAILGITLAALAEKAKGTPVETDLKDFKEDFDAFGIQPVPADPALQALKDTYAIESKTAMEIIDDLKKQLAESQNATAAASDKVIMEIDKVKYVVNHGAYPHSREELAKQPAFAKELLKKKGQNALTQL